VNSRFNPNIEISPNQQKQKTRPGEFSGTGARYNFFVHQFIHFPEVLTVQFLQYCPTLYHHPVFGKIYFNLFKILLSGILVRGQANSWGVRRGCYFTPEYTAY
jgi:hypothetical protein